MRSAAVQWCRGIEDVVNGSPVPAVTVGGYEQRVHGTNQYDVLRRLAGELRPRHGYRNIAMESQRGACTSGFSFWSNDIGGFVTKSPESLYLRWLPYGMLTSHSRVHGVETEPWLYDDKFVDYFRECSELKYRLMPYVYE